MSAKSLYICYFGLREPLVQTQVLPYLRELLKDGYEITLLTFEPDMNTKWTGEQIARAKAEMSAEGIEWECLAYHKRPSALATAYDIFRGALRVKGIIEKKKIDILHGRVHVPTLMGALGRKFSRRKPKLLFDIRGFFPEEYTEAGIWSENGAIYRAVKRIEKWVMKESDAFVVLTQKARGILFDREIRPVEVIPCCVDLNRRFSIDQEAERRRIRNELGIQDRFVFVHAGALGGLYLTEKIVELLDTARRRDVSVFAMFLTQSDPGLIVPFLEARGFSHGDYFVGKVSPEQIPSYLCAADAGLSFVKAGYATQSRSPTKIPEYLACGLPVVANRGVGDVDELILGDRLGVLVNDFSETGYSTALDELEALGDIREECYKAAKSKFDLEGVGGRRYRRLYEKLVTDGE